MPTKPATKLIPEQRIAFIDKGWQKSKHALVADTPSLRNRAFAIWVFEAVNLLLLRLPQEE